MIIGAIEHKTNIRLKIWRILKVLMNAIDIDYDSEDVTFTEYFFKLNTPHFKTVKRSAYAKSTKYMQEIV